MKKEKIMRSINPATSVILLSMGAILLMIGLWQLIKYFICIKKPYVTIQGEITGCDKEIHHSRMFTRTLCRAKLRFDYEGKTYNVKDENAVPEDVYDKLYGDNMTCGIRLINGDPYSAALDCKESLAAGRNEGLKIIAIAVVVIVFALL